MPNAFPFRYLHPDAQIKILSPHFKVDIYRRYSPSGRKVNYEHYDFTNSIYIKHDSVAGLP